MSTPRVVSASPLGTYLSTPNPIFDMINDDRGHARIPNNPPPARPGHRQLHSVIGRVFSVVATGRPGRTDWELFVLGIPRVRFEIKPQRNIDDDAIDCITTLVASGLVAWDPERADIVLTASDQLLVDASRWASVRPVLKQVSTVSCRARYRSPADYRPGRCSSNWPNPVSASPSSPLTNAPCSSTTPPIRHSTRPSSRCHPVSGATASRPLRTPAAMSLRSRSVWPSCL